MEYDACGGVKYRLGGCKQIKQDYDWYDGYNTCNRYGWFDGSIAWLTWWNQLQNCRARNDLRNIYKIQPKWSSNGGVIAVSIKRRNMELLRKT